MSLHWIIFIVFAAVICTVLLLRSRWEKAQLKVEDYRIRCNVPEAGDLTAVFLSDLHDYCIDYGSAGLLQKIRGIAPDLVLLGGDMITCHPHQGWNAEIQDSLEFICELAKDFPVFYGEGNHEARLRERQPGSYTAYEKALSEAGVILLKDSAVHFRGLAIHSVTLDESFYFRRKPGQSRKQSMSRDCLLKKLGMPTPGEYNILLMHSPLYHEEAAAWGADLVLSGHFHGGTIRIPLPGQPGLMTPQLQFFVKECSGMHKRKMPGGRESVMIVSRGIGTHSVNVRLNDLPEISRIELSGE